jgi:hypothetical protein
MLAGSPRGKIVIKHVLVGDAPTFAFMLEVAFAKIGYEVSPSPLENQNLSFIVYSPAPYRRFEGVEMQFSDKHPTYGDKIKEALIGSGIPVLYTPDSNMGAGEAEIDVVERP